MTPAEIVATWMEPRPGASTGLFEVDLLVFKWWCRSNCEWAPSKLDLDRLREVQARLTDEQWRHYAVLMFHRCCTEARTTNVIEDLLTKNRKALLHASIEDRLAALAEVLRPVVENQL